MAKRTEEAAVYGLVNGLGAHGNPTTKRRIIRSAQRAASRGDWDKLVELGVSYLIGAYIGGTIRAAAAPNQVALSW